MKRWLDRAVYVGAVFAVFAAGLAGYVIPKNLFRPDTVTIALEIPDRQPVITIYEYGPGEELPPPPPEFAYHVPVVNDFDESIYVYRNTNIYSDEEKMCLAKNIYFEAKNQSLKGQIAVALVTMNRVRSSAHPDTVCGVVYDHQQFSWYWDGKSDRPRHQPSWDEAVMIADAILDPEAMYADFTYGSDHYHADYVDPYWSEHYVRVVQIETHIFYRAAANQSL